MGGAPRIVTLPLSPGSDVSLIRTFPLPLWVGCCPCLGSCLARRWVLTTEMIADVTESGSLEVLELFHVCGNMSWLAG